MRHGRLIYLVGPSGAGKDTLLRWIATQAPAALHIARRCINRAGDDPNEAHEAITAARFAELAAAGAFALRWEANGLHYGVRHAELAPLAQGRDVLLNGSRAHLATARQSHPGLRAVLLGASPEVLRQRLLARGREDAAAVEARLARNALLERGDFDLRIVNDGAPEVAARQLLELLAN